MRSGVNRSEVEVKRQCVSEGPHLAHAQNDLDQKSLTTLMYTFMGPCDMLVDIFQCFGLVVH